MLAPQRQAVELQRRPVRVRAVALVCASALRLRQEAVRAQMEPEAEAHSRRVVRRARLGATAQKALLECRSLAKMAQFHAPVELAEEPEHLADVAVAVWRESLLRVAFER